MEPPVFICDHCGSEVLWVVREQGIDDLEVFQGTCKCAGACWVGAAPHVSHEPAQILVLAGATPAQD